MYRDAQYETIEELLSLQGSRIEKLGEFWYDNWLWYFFHGRDQQRYSLVSLRSALTFVFQDYLPNALLCSRDKRLEFVTPESLQRMS